MIFYKICTKTKINNDSKNEISYLLKLQNTNTVPKLYDIFQSKTHYYLIMKNMKMIYLDY